VQNKILVYSVRSGVDNLMGVHGFLIGYVHT